MRIDLMMQHITLERFEFGEAGDWNGNVWSVPCCVLGLGSNPATERINPPPDEVVHERYEGRGVRLLNKQHGFVLRRESDEGGIFWDPVSNSVFAVDDEAYHAMLELDRGLSPTQVARQLGVDAESVFELVRSLSEIAAAGAK